MNSFVLLSKVTPPKSRGIFISRKKLEEKLTGFISDPPSVSLVIAPPGYGKTSLVSSWISENSHCAWLTIGKADNIFLSFIRYLNSSIRRPFPDFGDLISMTAASPISRTPEYYSEVFAYEIEKLNDNLTLVIDNYQDINDGRITEFISSILDNMPGNLNFMVLSQEDPEFSISRRRLTQSINELRQDDLVFSLEEINDVVTNKAGVSLSEEYIRKIEKKTEGWPAAVSLCALSLLKLDDESRMKTIDNSLASYNYVIDYFSDWIVSDIDKDVLDFIVDTVLMESFNSTLADFVRQKTDSESVIRQLKKKHLPFLVQETDQQWYRYHTLFSEYINSRYKNPDKYGIYFRASEWFENHNHLNAAFKYAVLSGRSSRIEELTVRESENMFLTGKFEIISDFLDDSEKALLNNPSVLKVKLWADYLAGNFISMEIFNEHLDESFDFTNSEIPGPVLCLKAWVLYRTGNSSFKKYAEDSFLLLRSEKTFYSYMAIILHGKNLFLSGRAKEAAEILSAAAAELKDSGKIFIYCVVINNLMYALSASGNSGAALKIGERVLSGEISDTAYIPEESFILTAMARICLDSGNLKKAAEYAEQALESIHLMEVCRFLVEDSTVLLDDIREKYKNNSPDPDGRMKNDIPPVEELSKREKEILTLLSRGHSNREIGELLYISTGTVKWHLNNIFGKLNVDSRMQAILKAGNLNIR